MCAGKYEKQNKHFEGNIARSKFFNVSVKGVLHWHKMYLVMNDMTDIQLAKRQNVNEEKKNPLCIASYMIPFEGHFCAKLATNYNSGRIKV